MKTTISPPQEKNQLNKTTETTNVELSPVVRAENETQNYKSGNETHDC